MALAWLKELANSHETVLGTVMRYTPRFVIIKLGGVTLLGLPNEIRDIPGGHFCLLRPGNPVTFKVHIDDDGKFRAVEIRLDGVEVEIDEYETGEVIGRTDNGNFFVKRTIPNCQCNLLVIPSQDETLEFKIGSKVKFQLRESDTLLGRWVGIGGRIVQ